MVEALLKTAAARTIKDLQTTIADALSSLTPTDGQNNQPKPGHGPG
jgi:hypothetical protein